MTHFWFDKMFFKGKKEMNQKLFFAPASLCRICNFIFKVLRHNIPFEKTFYKISEYSFLNIFEQRRQFSQSLTLGHYQK